MANFYKPYSGLGAILQNQQPRAADGSSPLIAGSGDGYQITPSGNSPSSYTPEASLASMNRYAQSSFAPAKATSFLGALSEGLKGGARGWMAGMANKGLQSNQAISRRGMDAAAKDPGNAAAALMASNDPKQRQAGLQMAMQQALEDRKTRAQIAMAQIKQQIAQNSPEGKLKLEKMALEVDKLKEGDPFKDFMRAQINQMIGGQAPVAQAAPGTAPSSGAPATQVPQTGVLNVAGAGTPEQGQAPVQGQATGVIPVAERPLAETPERSAEDIIDIPPFGKKTRKQFEALAGTLAMDPRGSGLAKIISDRLNRSAIPPSSQMGTVGSNRIDEAEFNATEQLARFAEIEDSFDPEFLTYEEHWKQKGIEWADSFKATRDMLTPEQLARHERYSGFITKSTNNMNLYIKEITGAQMSETEADRIRLGVPDPQRDGPTKFKTKLTTAKNTAELAIIRYRMMRKYGFQGQPWKYTGDPNKEGEALSKAMPLGKVKSQMSGHIKKLAIQIKNANPSLRDDQALMQAGQAFRQEIGI